MKIPFLTTALVLLAASAGQARDFGVSSRSAGRGTVYTDNRGGSAYVGPNGVAAQGANGRSAAVTDRGAAVVDSNGSAAVTNNNTYVNRSGTAYYGGTGGAVVTTGAAPLPAGYITAVPIGAPTFAVSGYNCYFINGIYYRPVFYGGTTVYVPVT
jgi:hypothetical protein